MSFNFLNEVEKARPGSNQVPYLQFKPDKTQAKYKLKVNRLTLDKAEFKGFEFFLAEFEVLESDHPEFPPGSLCCRMFPFHGDKKSKIKDEKTAKEMMAFFCALTGLPAGDIKKPDILDACSPKQPMAGYSVQVHALHHKAQSGSDFTKCIWQHVHDETPPEIESAGDDTDGEVAE